MKTRTTALIAPLLLCASLLAAINSSAGQSEAPKSLADAKNSRASQQKEAQMKRSDSSSSQRQSLSDLQSDSGSADTSTESMQMSGAGRNGPDQAGVSIPVVIDRGLQMDSFLNARTQCEKQAAIALLAQLIRQEVKDAAFAKDWRSHAIIVFDVNGYILSFATHIPDYERKTTFVFNRPGMFTSANLQGQSIPRFRVTPEIEKQLLAASENKAEFVGGLKLTYDIKQDSGYDALGNFSTGEQFVTKYQIKESPIYRKIDSSFDPNSKFKTPLRLSAEEFKQCLQNQLN